MATTSSNNTDRAIEQLTKQIAELSINLAEKQTSPTPKPIYYSDSDPNRHRSDNNNNQWDATCYYCRSKGHFIKIAIDEKKIIEIALTLITDLVVTLITILALITTIDPMIEGIIIVTL